MNLHALIFVCGYVALFGGLADACESWWFRVFWIALGLWVPLVVGAPKPRRPASHLPDPPKPRV